MVNIGFSENGLPHSKLASRNAPQWYPTHSVHIMWGAEAVSRMVSCLEYPPNGTLQKKNNSYKNPFATEISLYRTSEGGMARMARSADTIGIGYGGETGRVRGTKGSFYDKYEGIEKNLPDLTRPALPPGLAPGGHGGAHGHLTNEFVTAILDDRKPRIDIAMALNLTVGGIVAHQSALRNGEWLKIPQFKF